MKKKVDIEGLKETFDIIDKIFEKNKDMKWGESRIVECPKCKGKVYIFISSENGHKHMRCENGCFALME